MINPLVFRQNLIQESQQRPSDINEPYSCMVTVNMSVVHVTIKKMVDIIVNYSYRTATPFQDHDSIYELVTQSVNSYLEFILSWTNNKEPVSYESFLTEYFPSVAEAIINDPYAFASINLYFATVVGQLANQLACGVGDLHENGYEVTTIDTYKIQPGLNAYVIQGSDYGLDLEDGGE